MLNPRNANEELHARLSEILLGLKLRADLTDDELHCLAYACGVQIPESRHETRLQRLQRMAREAEQTELRG